jgi:hypothetical protein
MKHLLAYEENNEVYLKKRIHIVSSKQKENTYPVQNSSSDEKSTNVKKSNSTGNYISSYLIFPKE